MNKQKPPQKYLRVYVIPFFQFPFNKQGQDQTNKTKNAKNKERENKISDQQSTINPRKFLSYSSNCFSKLECALTNVPGGALIVTYETCTRRVNMRKGKIPRGRFAVGRKGKKCCCQGSVIQNFHCTFRLSLPLATSHFQPGKKSVLLMSRLHDYDIVKTVLRLFGSCSLSERSGPSYLRP